MHMNVDTKERLDYELGSLEVKSSTELRQQAAISHDIPVSF